MPAKKTAKKTTKKTMRATRPKAKRANTMSAPDAAAKVLAETKTAMTAKEMIEAMAAKNYWRSPGGATPWSTLYAAIDRELKAKGKDARFKKVGPGKFALRR
jgi:vancomycin resistance protein YoaR